MFGGDVVETNIILEGRYAISYVIDWFGNNATIENVDGVIYANIKSNEKAFIYWTMQYGNHFKVIEPVNTKNKINAL